MSPGMRGVSKRPAANAPLHSDDEGGETLFSCPRHAISPVRRSGMTALLTPASDATDPGDAAADIANAAMTTLPEESPGASPAPMQAAAAQNVHQALFVRQNSTAAVGSLQEAPAEEPAQPAGGASADSHQPAEEADGEPVDQRGIQPDCPPAPTLTAQPSPKAPPTAQPSPRPTAHPPTLESQAEPDGAPRVAHLDGSQAAALANGPRPDASVGEREEPAEEAQRSDPEDLPAEQQSDDDKAKDEDIEALLASQGEPRCPAHKKDADPLAQGCKISNVGTVAMRGACKVRDQTLRMISGG
ncbi:unnamed protein product [Prorocentrum cordatum]|uniref:Uncharacterized protein n=1 Tax=Prorocentrum cordatum TaxID=2364126 RepID=A0ABN9X7S2_9DINO|nr:unnamed protein product [Polarella glacialis]